MVRYGKIYFQLNTKEQIKWYWVPNCTPQYKLQVPLFFLKVCETSQAQSLHKAKHSYMFSLVCEHGEGGGGGSLRITSDLNMAILPSVTTEGQSA